MHSETLLMERSEHTWLRSPIFLKKCAASHTKKPLMRHLLSNEYLLCSFNLRFSESPASGLRTRTRKIAKVCNVAHLVESN